MTNILVIMPNKLGDMILSIPFLRELKKHYPDSSIGVIALKNFAEITQIVPEIDDTYAITKQEYHGIQGKYRIGKRIRSSKKYQICFCLPHSFSSALVAFFSGSKQRIGYSTEGRGFLFTHSYKLHENIIHSSDDSLFLLDLFLGSKSIKSPYLLTPEQSLIKNELPQGPLIVFNRNSAKQSTTIPKEKAIGIIDDILKNFQGTVLMVGSPDEYNDVNDTIKSVKEKDRVLNFAGIGLPEIAAIIRKAGVLISTDTGIAHLGNFVGAKTIVLFGAADIKTARPWNSENLRIIKHETLSCVPCIQETCIYGDPKCLTELDNKVILKVLDEWTAIPKRNLN